MNSLRPLDTPLWPSKQQQGIILPRWLRQNQELLLKSEYIFKRSAICKDIIRGFANRSLFLGVGFWGQHLCFGILYCAEPSGGAQQKQPTCFSYSRGCRDQPNSSLVKWPWGCSGCSRNELSLFDRSNQPSCVPGSTWMCYFCLTQTIAWAQESCAEGEETNPKSSLNLPCLVHF